MLTDKWHRGVAWFMNIALLAHQFDGGGLEALSADFHGDEARLLHRLDGDDELVGHYLRHGLFVLLGFG